MATTKKGHPKKSGPRARRSRGAPDPFALGLDITDPLGVHRAILAGLPFASLERFERASQLPRAEVARLISTAPRTLARRQGEKKLHPGESERLFRVATLFRLSRGLFEGDETAARAWLRTPRPALGGKSPLELATTEVGARQVESLIRQLEHGVFA